MCGIAGYTTTQGTVDRDTLRGMCDAILHRGPDSDGLHLQDGFALGMRRLSIIDLEGGTQPIYNGDRSTVVTFNGEIYNYRELRAELVQKGYHFRTKSDTEVLVHLYDEYGVDMLQQLNGMFGFAIADHARGRVLLARDRLGIKPLFLAKAGQQWVWGSEIKAILRHPDVQRRVDPDALPDYLYLNYMPPGQTLFDGIEQLRPGEFALIEGDRLTRQEYWDLDFTPDPGLTAEKAAAGAMELLEDSVRLRLVADVPFGAFLSGGIDSSAVVAMMSRHMSEPVKTFTIAFGEESFDESPYAKQVAEQFGTDHHVQRVDPDVLGILDKLVWHSEEPTADSSAIPVYMVSELARQHVTMVLSGDGGDELFAGYPTYDAWWVREKYRRLPGWVRRGIVRPMVDALPVSNKKVSFDFKARRFVRGAEMGADEAHLSWRHIFSEEAKAGLLTDGAPAQSTYERWRHYFDRAPDASDPLARMLYFDTRFYLPGDMLVKVDRMSMAHSLEARTPFLDHRLVEYAARIPSEVKFAGKVHKKVLKDGLEPVLGRELLYRKKAGFNVPKHQWLRGPLLPRLREALAPAELEKHGYFRADTVERLIREHVEMKADHSFQLWSLLIFQLWHARFIEGVPVGSMAGTDP